MQSWICHFSWKIRRYDTWAHDPSLHTGVGEGAVFLRWGRGSLLIFPGDSPCLLIPAIHTCSWDRDNRLVYSKPHVSEDGPVPRARPATYLQGPVQNAEMEPVVQNLLRMSRWWQQRIKPHVGPLKTWGSWWLYEASPRPQNGFGSRGYLWFRCDNSRTVLHGFLER